MLTRGGTVRPGGFALPQFCVHQGQGDGPTPSLLVPVGDVLQVGPYLLDPSLIPPEDQQLQGEDLLDILVAPPPALVQERVDQPLGVLQPPVEQGLHRGLDFALDEIRRRFGSEAVTRAVLLGRDQGITVPMLPD